jgi:hypothetical protein
MATLAHRGGRAFSQNNQSKVDWPDDSCVGAIRGFCAYTNRGYEGFRRAPHERKTRGTSETKRPSQESHMRRPEGLYMLRRRNADLITVKSHFAAEKGMVGRCTKLDGIPKVRTKCLYTR